MAHRNHPTAAGAVLVLLGLVVVASLLPLAETDVWWIRWLDFPRLQFAVALLLLLPLFLLLRPGRTAAVVGTVAALAALGYHAYKLHPYHATTATEMAPGAASCPDGSRLSLMVANVQKRNENAGAFLDVVAEVAPDLLLVLETDAWWDEHLEPLRGDFAHEVQHVPEDRGAFGMHLLSKMELVDPEIRFLFGEFTPSIVTDIALPGGERVRLFGLHPRPPHAWGQPSTMRDGHLLAAALEARSAETPAILAGDFNAVPWERVNRRAMRIGRLLDPRVGRGLYPTFSANSALVSWPLDQILFQDGIALLGFRTLRSIGSDHYPVAASLCHAPEASAARSAPDASPDDLEEAEATIAAAREMGGGKGD